MGSWLLSITICRKVPALWSKVNGLPQAVSITPWLAWSHSYGIIKDWRNSHLLQPTSSRGIFVYKVSKSLKSAETLNQHSMVMTLPAPVTEPIYTKDTKSQLKGLHMRTSTVHQSHRWDGHEDLWSDTKPLHPRVLSQHFKNIPLASKKWLD